MRVQCVCGAIVPDLSRCYTCQIDVDVETSGDRHYYMPIHQILCAIFRSIFVFRNYFFYNVIVEMNWDVLIM